MDDFETRVMDELGAIRMLLEAGRRRAPTMTAEEEDGQIGAALARWAAVTTDWLTTAEVVKLGIEGIPPGSLRAVALWLDGRKGRRYRAPGSSESFSIEKRTHRHQAQWRIHP